MNGKLIKARLLTSGRWVAVLLAILAVVVSGASAAERLYAAQSAPEPEKSVETSQDALGQTPGTEEPAHGMAGGGGPFTEQPAYLQAMVMVTSGNSSQKTLLPALAVTFAQSSSWLRDSNVHSAATTAEVSGLLAHRFTLVGAKPSGTS